MKTKHFEERMNLRTRHRVGMVLLILSLWAATPVVAAPDDKLSSEKHAQVESAITKFMSAKSVPGLSAAIVENGELEWSQGYGMAELENFVRETGPRCAGAELLPGISPEIVAHHYTPAARTSRRKPALSF